MACLAIESHDDLRTRAAECPSLLVSIHDISPLTLDLSRRAIELAGAAGVPPSALTLLVIPRHEDRAPLDEHYPTRDWVRGLVDAGACLCMHGLTHLMPGQVRNPWKWALARGFARGQGELLAADTGECAYRLSAAMEIFRRAGLQDDVKGFVPPAWLLSADALEEVKRAGFGFYERFGGIVHRDAIWARRLVGFGSLTWAEARMTAAYALCQSRLAAADTRFAIHPADLARASSIAAIQACLRRLTANLAAVNYSDFLRAKAA